MKSSRPKTGSRNGFTLLEMTIVIMMLLALINIGLFTSKKMDEWKLGRAASETLRSVYAAQRMYLADNPVTSVADLTDGMLIPYIPNLKPKTPQWTTLVLALDTVNTVKPLSGSALAFKINDVNSTPYFTQGGVRYDPSASPPDYKDSLWDVGE